MYICLLLREISVTVSDRRQCSMRGGSSFIEGRKAVDFGVRVVPVPALSLTSLQS